AAVSAVFDHHHRVGGRRARRHRPGRRRARAAHGRTVRDRPGRDRRARRQRARALAGARPRRAPADVVPRHPAAAGRRRRSVFHALPCHRRGGGGRARARTRTVAGHVPVALRARTVAAAGDRLHPAGAGRRRGRPCRRGLPRLPRRLPGNAGGDRAAERGALPRGRRPGAVLHPEPQRRAGARRRAGGAGAARVRGVALMHAFDLDIPLGRIAGLRWGEPGAPRVLALHGWLDNAASFVPLAAEFERIGTRVDLVAPDLPGHGRSAHLPPGADYSFAGALHAALDVADALGWERFALLGHSMGAGIASLVAAGAPARVQRLLAIEALGALPEAPENTARRLREAVAATRALPGKRLRV